MRASIVVIIVTAVGTACTTRAARTAGDMAGMVTGPTAIATLRTSSGDSVGYIRLEPRAPGVQIIGHVRGLNVGAHGIHLHEAGRCDGDFSSAGAHFNPAHRKHGLVNPEGPHAGDLPAIVVGESETAIDLRATQVTLDGAAGSGLLDADGSAVVIHAAPDDQRTDPSGGSGARIVCGIIRRV